MAPKKASSRVSNPDNRNTGDSDVPVESGHLPHQPEQISLPHPPAPTLSPPTTEMVTRDQFNALVQQVQLLTAAFQASQAQHQAALQAGSMAASQPSPVGPSAAPQQQPRPAPIAARQPSPDRPVESQPSSPAPQQQQIPTTSHRSQQPPVAPHLSGSVPVESRGRHARRRPPSPLSSGEESTPHSSPFRRAFSQHSQLAPDREAIVDQRFQEMSKRIEALQNKVSVPVSSARSEPPFSEKIMREPIPANFKVPPIESYDGSTDPNDHVDDFQNQMLLRQTSDALLCRAFPSTLRGVAKHWFNALKPGSIDCFQDLVNSFAAHFVSSQKRRKGSDYLVTIKQREGESLRSYLNRFNAAILEVRQLDPSVAMTAMKSGLRKCPFLFSIKKTYPRSWPEMLARAEKYANAEDEDEPKELQAGDKPRMVPQSPSTEDSTKATGRESSHKRRPHPSPRRRRDRSPDRRHVPTARYLTPLNSSREAILMEIGTQLPEPQQMRTQIHHRRDPHLYCRYHRDHGHDTEHCVHLQDEIEKLIQRGALQRFVLGRNPPRPFRQPRPHPRGNHPPIPPQQQPQLPIPQPQPRQPAPQAPRQAPEPGESSAAAATRVPRAEINVIEAQSTEMPGMQASKKQKIGGDELFFTEKDAVGVQFPHNDPLVVSMDIDDCLVHRVLIDNGSTINVLYFSAFEKMGYSLRQLQAFRCPVTGFGGTRLSALGAIDLPVTVGTPPRQVTIRTKFAVFDLPTAYNAIFGRPGQHALRATTSSHYQMMKFPTEQGVGILRGDQMVARECLATRLEEAEEEDRLELPMGLDAREELIDERAQPSEDLVSIPLRADAPCRTVKIGSHMDEGTKSQMITLLQENADLFAWTAKDMPGISPEVITHRLNVDPTYRPVKQKKRSFAPERQKAIIEEVDKLMEAGFIRESAYPEWLANVVLVKKASGKWRMCIDFTDLNKACPKDSYPLPRIDQLVDATSGHELLTFMDAFSGYNQIRMAPEDEEKTAFIADAGLYCYKVMPFGLKNAGATYQRLVNKIFKEQIGRNMEVYVDDMLVKSRTTPDHIADLRETFDTLRRFQMKLNPNKCAFGVTSGKFLGFMVSRRGIEANPEKINAILEMLPPSNVKDVQRLTGKVASLNRFISKSAERCLPFFRTLKQPKDFQWTLECQKAFEELKQYLSSPPLLTKSQPGEELFLYLAVSPAAVGAALVRQEGTVQRPVYYVSKVLHDAETRYSKLEKLIFALIISARKLRPYFQAHSITLLTDQPIRDILHRPSTSGRLAKWALELSEFDIRYRPRPSVKAQVLADFIVECTISDVLEEKKEGSSQEGPSSHPVEADRLHSVDPEEVWILSVDGSSGVSGAGAGVVLTSPEGDVLSSAVRFDFPATNNEAEYEALIAGLKAADAVGAKHLKVFSDSQLVVGHIRGNYEAREENMRKYLQKVKDLISSFTSFDVHQIPRTENVKADMLSRLASCLPPELEKETYFEVLKTPSIGEPPLVMQVDEEPCWIDPILNFLKAGELPTDQKQARKIKYQAARYVLYDDKLYKRSYSLPLLKCLRPSEADYAMREVHEGICGNHLGGRSLSYKILRQGYYWPTMQQDAQAFVRRCDRCQRNAHIQRQSASFLVPVSSPWPFAQWGMDILGPFPNASGQRKFLLVAIDYFTKWVEAEPLAKITEARVTNFIWKSIVCRYGLPKVIITDNGRQFCGAQLRKFCEDHMIEQRFTSVAHPQANGEAEVTNKTLLQGIKSRLERTGGSWVDELYHVLWAYRTTQRVPTGETPFNLAFGTEAMIPLEFGIPSLRVEEFKEDTNDIWLRANLDLIEESRERAAMRMASYRQRVARYYNARVKPKEFRPGDLVLRRAEVSQPSERGKLTPNWEGPYFVEEMIRPGTYKLKSMNETLLPRPWNSANLRVYYP